MSDDLSKVYGISAATMFSGVAEFLTRLAAALDKGLGMLQVRDKGMDDNDRLSLAKKCVGMCRGSGCKVLVNGDIEIARKSGADGVHLPSRRLGGGRAGFDGIVGASCHDEAELGSAFGNAGADFAVLSPVLVTSSHEEATPLGWAGFEKLARARSGPVYALGGLRVGDLATAKRHGAAGVASMRDVWGLPLGASGQEGPR